MRNKPLPGLIKRSPIKAPTYAKNMNDPRGPSKRAGGSSVDFRGGGNLFGGGGRGGGGFRGLLAGLFPGGGPTGGGGCGPIGCFGIGGG
tara:strand:- start:516 stop:782 length:267 start_codon:yes stop_codon:yes gene_type:complete